jgi:hypothetical protein
MSDGCKHGHEKNSCTACYRERELSDLRAENERLKSIIEGDAQRLVVAASLAREQVGTASENMTLKSQLAALREAAQDACERLDDACAHWLDQRTQQGRDEGQHMAGIRDILRSALQQTEAQPAVDVLKKYDDLEFHEHFCLSCGRPIATETAECACEAQPARETPGPITKAVAALRESERKP